MISTYNEILENLFVPLYGIAFILSIIQYRKYFESSLKYLPIILGYTLANEILGSLIIYNEKYQIIYSEGNRINNNVIFNIWEIIFFLYFFYIFWKNLKRENFKTTIKYGALAYIAISIANPFIQSFTLYPQIYALTTASILIVISTTFYFIELQYKKPSIISRNLLFWASIGLLIFHLFYPFIMWLIIYNLDIYYQWSIRPLHLSLIVIMYSCIITGFVRMTYLKRLNTKSCGEIKNG